MSKDKILKRMEEVVNSVMTSFQSDFFKYDKPAIEAPEFKFPAIWIVGESHTALLSFKNYKKAFFDNESVRYDYISDCNAFSYYLNCNNYAKDNWFMLTEDGLSLISRDQAKEVIQNHVSSVVNAWIEENGPLPKLSKLKVVIRNISLSKLKELIADCEAHGDSSLLKCLKNFHNYRRRAADQYIEVQYNSCWNEFSFCEMTNGKVGLNGVIVFHGWSESGYQTNGSVQIDPHYGWSTHT